MKAFNLISVTFLVLTINGRGQDYSFKKAFDIGTPSTLSITTTDGDINITPSDNQETEVFFIAKKNGTLLDITLDELKESYSIEINRTSNSLEIIAKPKNKNSNWKNKIVLSFDVFTPTKTSCSLKTSDGDIYIKSLEGEQNCKTSDGNISLSDILGSSEAATSDGDIQVNDCNGNSNVKTSDGDIKLNNIQGNLYAKTSDGDIDFQRITGGITSVTSDGRIEGKIIAINYPTELKTSDGDIKLILPDGSGFDLEMRGENLHADFNDFNGDISDNYISGEINGGGEPVKLTTSDGRINLNFE